MVLFCASLYLMVVAPISFKVLIGGLSAILLDPKPCKPRSSFRVHTAAYLRTTQHIHTRIYQIPNGN